MNESRFASYRRVVTGFVGSVSRNRLLMAFLGAALIPLAVTGSIMYYKTSTELMRTQTARLNAVRAVKVRHIEHYFKMLRDTLAVIGHSRLAVQGIADLAGAVGSLGQRPVGAEADSAAGSKGPRGKTIAEMRAELRTYYKTDFLPEYVKHNPGRKLDAAALVEPLCDAAVYLQYWYVLQNTNAADDKLQLDKADDGSRYSELHARIQPIMRDFVHRFGFYDVFFVDLKSGMIVYTVMKEIDFGTSLKTGPYAATGLGRVFRQAATSTLRDSIAFSDYQPYLPSYGAPASFIATPVFQGSKKIGVVIFQMPIDEIDSIMRETVAFGLTGEAYLVGPDRLFRSESRFTKQLGLTTTTINPAIKVDTAPVRAVFADGTSGSGATMDYRKTLVLSSWAPVTVCPANPVSGHGAVKWALIAETDMSEVHAPAYAVRRVAIIVFLITTALVLWLAFLATRRLSRETKRQTKLVVGIVENTEAMASASEELSSVSELLSANAEQTTAQANVVSSAAEQVSTSAQTVATGVDNLSASIQEIAGSAKQAADVATIAVQAADVANQRINQLGDSSKEIGAVVKVITQIAEQTNLLALNATIEAARAGEAGKGFAVVANEVKELARETAKATENIRNKIEVIQQDTSQAIDAIGEISSIIHKISDLQNTIANAVDEQTTTTAEISHNVSEAATGSVEIAHNITQVAEAARGTAEGAANTRVSAQELAHMAANLQRLVDEYKDQA